MAGFMLINWGTSKMIGQEIREVIIRGSLHKVVL